MEKNKKPGILNYLLPVIMASAGLLHYARHGLDLVGVVPVVLGAFALYLVLFNFPLLQRIEVFIIKAWYPVGQCITAVLLTVTFFLVFAPVGILLRLFKKDILNRKFKVDCSSYWIDRPVKEENNYTQQF